MPRLVACGAVRFLRAMVGCYGVVLALVGVVAVHVVGGGVGVLLMVLVVEEGVLFMNVRAKR